MVLRLPILKKDVCEDRPSGCTLARNVDMQPYKYSTYLMKNTLYFKNKRNAGYFNQTAKAMSLLPERHDNVFSSL